jgi:hypothetical protein
MQCNERNFLRMRFISFSLLSYIAVDHTSRSSPTVSPLNLHNNIDAIDYPDFSAANIVDLATAWVAPV